MAGSISARPSIGCLLRAKARNGLSTHTAPFTGTAPFSTTAQRSKRKTKDNNKNRGVSSLYGSGPREHLSMSDVPLPRPRDFKPKIAVDPDHGLWGFFPEPDKALWTPKETEEHGRAWTVEELRKKSWEDLHSLWWVCCRERNMLATSKAELLRSKIGFGERELDVRIEEVRKTMRAIKHTLTERYYTWQDAVEVAGSDPEIDVNAKDGQAYKASAFEEDTAEEKAWTSSSRERGDGLELTQAQHEPSR